MKNNIYQLFKVRTYLAPVSWTMALRLKMRKRSINISFVDPLLLPACGHFLLSLPPPYSWLLTPYLWYVRAQSCSTLCTQMDWRPPGFRVHGIFQARILEWVAISSSRESCQPGDRAHVSCVPCIGRQILYNAPPGKPQWLTRALKVWLWNCIVWDSDLRGIEKQGLAKCNGKCKEFCKERWKNSWSEFMVYFHAKFGG